MKIVQMVGLAFVVSAKETSRIRSGRVSTHFNIVTTGSEGRRFWRRGEGLEPNSPSARVSLGLARILFGFRSLDFLWVSFGRGSCCHREGSAHF